MNGSDRQLLLAVSGLLHYPDDDFFVQARSIEELCGLLSVVRAYPLREFIRSARSKGLSSLREEHVAIFDMDGKCSLSLAWHRYGDDPRLGRALAGLNELYRDAGFEPVRGILPDYLPLVLEFLSAAPDCSSTVSARSSSASMPRSKPGTPAVPISRCSGQSLRFSASSRINAFPRSGWGKFRWGRGYWGKGENVFERRERPCGFPLSFQNFRLMGHCGGRSGCSRFTISHNILIWIRFTGPISHREESIPSGPVWAIRYSTNNLRDH